jgi:DNA polymerase-3 subunit beta
LSEDCIQLKQALGRTVILSDERYKGVRLSLSTGHLLISVHNTEQEEAEEDLDADYRGDSLEIGFNAQYLSDALGAVDTPQVELYFNDPNSSCLLRPKGDESVKYVIMPMRL